MNSFGKPIRYQDVVDGWKKEFKSKSTEYIKGCIAEYNRKPTIVKIINAFWMTSNGARFAGANQAIEEISKEA